jgi:hypothetical protein
MKPLVALLKQTIAADPFRCCLAFASYGLLDKLQPPTARPRAAAVRRRGEEGHALSFSHALAAGARGLQNTSLSNLNVVRT